MNPLAAGRQMVLVAAVEELVAPALEERHVRVHARAVLPEERLRHERRVVAVPGGDFLDDESVRHRVVGHLESARRSACRSRAARGRPRDGGTRSGSRPTRAQPIVSLRISVAASERGHGEVPALVDRLRPLVVLEDEVLELRADVERVEAEILHARERLPEDVPRVTLVRRTIRSHHVADQARDLGADRLPRSRRGAAASPGTSTGPGWRPCPTPRSR